MAWLQDQHGVATLHEGEGKIFHWLSACMHKQLDLRQAALI